MTTYIGITGYAQSGKTTMAKAAVYRFADADRVAKVRPFASAVKSIAVDHFGWDGVKDERGRRLLQVLGTDAGRAYDPDIWVRKWADTKPFSWAEYIPSGVLIADDVRFQNEADAIRELGGFIIRVHRKGHDAGDHASEQDMPVADLEYHNDGTIDDMRAWVRQHVVGRVK